MLGAATRVRSTTGEPVKLRLAEQSLIYRKQ